MYDRSIRHEQNGDVPALFWKLDIVPYPQRLRVYLKRCSIFVAVFVLPAEEDLYLGCGLSESVGGMF